MNYRKAFTLIELLVVISIIALLLAIMMPALNKARNSAKAAVCMSNLKQWGLATVMYYDEHDSKMWPDSYATGGLQIRGDWIEVLRPYYNDLDDIRLCPMATKPCQDPQSERRGSVDTHWGIKGEQTGETSAGYYGSYGLNRWVTNPGPNATDGQWFWKRAVINRGREIPVFLDSTHWHFRPKDSDPIPPKKLLKYNDVPVDTGNQMWRVCLDRHSGGVNCAFFDGSVDKVILPKLWDLKWHRAFKMRHYTLADFPWLN